MSEKSTHHTSTLESATHIEVSTRWASQVTFETGSTTPLDIEIPGMVVIIETNPMDNFIPPSGDG
jgi:hypothetical protein